MLHLLDMNTKTTDASKAEQVKSFLNDNPEIKKYLEKQSEKGNFPAEYTPRVVEIKFEGLTYVRYDTGEIVASRECARGYMPPFWEVCFEEESAFFMLSPNIVLLDRVSDMAELDLILKDCKLPVATS